MLPLTIWAAACLSLRRRAGENAGSGGLYLRWAGSATFGPDAPDPLTWFSLPAGLQNAVSCLTAQGASPHILPKQVNEEHFHHDAF